MIYTIETGGQRWKADGRNINEAIVRAWAKAPPETPGILSRYRYKPQWLWNYIETSVLLKKAGYSVRYVYGVGAQRKEGGRDGKSNR